MVDATITRGNTTITLPLRGDGSGVPVVARDIGKPNAAIKEDGSTINPRFVDVYSGQETFTLHGVFLGADAYDDAIALCDLVKSGMDTNITTLDIDMAEFDADMEVAPTPTESAATLAYPPGTRRTVVVDVSFVRVSETTTSADDSDVATTLKDTTPTASGSGPLTISNGSKTVALSSGLTVERSVGRPKSVLEPVPHAISEHPKFYEKYKTPYDQFELGLNFPTGGGSTIQDLKDVVSTRLGRSGLTLDFQGLYGMGSISVLPEGSGALRHVVPTGETDTAVVPSLSLRRVA